MFAVPRRFPNFGSKDMSRSVRAAPVSTTKGNSSPIPNRSVTNIKPPRPAFVLRVTSAGSRGWIEFTVTQELKSKRQPSQASWNIGLMIQCRQNSVEFFRMAKFPIQVKRVWFPEMRPCLRRNPEPPLGLVPCPQPTWATPGVNPQTGLPYTPAQPSPSWDPNVGESVCGFLAALLGVILTLCGGAAEGVGLIAGGVTAGVNGLEQLNWDQLACSLFWLKWYAYNQLFNLHVLSAVGGFQHPYPSELADFGYSTIPIPPSLEADALWYYAGATYTCKSRAIDSMLMPWQPTGGADWIFYPTLAGTPFYPPGGA